MSRSVLEIQRKFHYNTDLFLILVVFPSTNYNVLITQSKVYIYHKIFLLYTQRSKVKLLTVCSQETNLSIRREVNTILNNITVEKYILIRILLCVLWVGIKLFLVSLCPLIEVCAVYMYRLGEEKGRQILGLSLVYA